MGCFGGGKPKKQTVGYHYALGMHMLICYGPIEGIKQIWVGEKVVWPTPNDDTVLQADGANTAVINARNIFGGEDKEGGVVGTVNIEYGESTQAVNSYLVSRLDPNNGYVPAFRGLVGIVLRQVRVGTSAYIKPWSFLCKRTVTLQNGQDQWYLAKAEIGSDLNPIHIIRECLTNTTWGLGYSVSYVNDAVFMAAADTLYDEDFGLSFIWDNDVAIEDFVNLVLQHIDGTLYQDVSTGMFNIALARDDYTPAALTVFDETDITEIKEFKRESYGETVNQIVIKYSDVIKNKKVTATAQDIAMMDIQGGNIIELEFDYMGITDGDLANRVAARELRQITSMVAKMSIVANRSMAVLAPNDVFKITWPILDIEEMILRVISINYGELADGRVIIDAIEDVFAAGTALYTTPPPTDWEPPVSDPLDITEWLVMEVPYYVLFQELGETILGALGSTAGYMGVAVGQVVSDSTDFELYVRDTPSADLIYREVAGYTPTATLESELPLNAVDATIQLLNTIDMDLILVDSFAVIEDEFVKVLAIDTALEQVTIARGVFDTVPAVHDADSRIWFAGSESIFHDYLYTDGDQPGFAALPITGNGTLEIGDATPHNSPVMASRASTPYPPGNLKVDGVSYPTTFTGQPELTWYHRNRDTQILVITEHSDYWQASVPAGVTYTLEIYDETLTNLIRTETGIIAAGYTYDELDERSDSGLGSADPLNTQLRFVLKAVEGGVDSWQEYDIIVARA